MQAQDALRVSRIRALLDSTHTPFSVASYAPGAAILFQGDLCDSVMLVERGQVRLAVTARNGHEASCGLLGPGAFLGEEGLGGHATYRHAVIALTATEVLVVATPEMLRLLHTQPAMADFLLAHVLGRHAHLEADLLNQLFNSGEQRLARALLALAASDGPRPYPRALPRVSQEVIAEMVGTTRSRVNSFIGKFKRLGLVAKDGRRLQVTPALLQFVREGRPAVSNATPR